jgi:murein tripeptide amidase MpaA
VIVGRQHSGETHSSFIIHGLINFLLSRDVLSHKLREHFEFWILPQINPDGIVAGNYRCNTQGKDMNRCFFADDDPEAKHRLHEVELIRAFMEDNFSKKVPEKRAKLKMFLDVHAHSGQRDIFIYAPHATQEDAMSKI